MREELEQEHTASMAHQEEAIQARQACEAQIAAVRAEAAARVESERAEAEATWRAASKKIISKETAARKRAEAQV